VLSRGTQPLPCKGGGEQDDDHGENADSAHGPGVPAFRRPGISAPDHMSPRSHIDSAVNAPARPAKVYASDAGEATARNSDEPGA
jgi:hypothetical protein